MSYKVIHYFEDLQDNSYPYNVGDIFPRVGFSVSDKRLQELSGVFNKQGKKLIELVDDESVQEEITKAQISKMSLAELKEFAAKSGIADSEKLKAGSLKKQLIEHFGL